MPRASPRLQIAGPTAQRATSSSGSGHLRAPHPDRVFLLELLEPRLEVVDGAVELGQQHVLQRAGAAHRAPVFVLQALEVAGDGGERRRRGEQRRERAAAGLGLGRRVDARRRRRRAGDELGVLQRARPSASAVRGARCAPASRAGG